MERKELDKKTIKRVTEKLNELYILKRDRYLVMRQDGSYITLTKKPRNNVRNLNDGYIALHLTGKATYGVFAGLAFTKFITFDVDTQSEQESKWVAQKLVETLVEKFNIDIDDIHVSVSGSKGYHVDLFFEDVISNQRAATFYKAVIYAVGMLPEGCAIEFRPTHTQGVKMPLGTHFKTGRTCYFCDTKTLEEIESYEYILNIKPMNAEKASRILDVDEPKPSLDIKTKEAEKFERAIATVDHEANVVTKEDQFAKAQRILRLGRLERPGTRNDVTFLLARFLNEYGWEADAIIDEIMKILSNTPEDFFNHDDEYNEKEAIRITHNVIEQQYSLGMREKDVEITKSEILHVLKARTVKQQSILYAILVHGKRFARNGEEFYMSYNIIQEMTGANPNTVSNNLTKLHEAGLIELKRGKIDKVSTRAYGRPLKHTNRFKVPVEMVKGEPSITISTKNPPDFKQVVADLLPAEELKEHIPAHEFRRHFKALYAS